MNAFYNMSPGIQPTLCVLCHQGESTGPKCLGNMFQIWRPT